MASLLEKFGLKTPATAEAFDGALESAAAMFARKTTIGSAVRSIVKQVPSINFTNSVGPEVASDKVKQEYPLTSADYTTIDSTPSVNFDNPVSMDAGLSSQPKIETTVQAVDQLTDAQKAYLDAYEGQPSISDVVSDQLFKS